MPVSKALKHAQEQYRKRNKNKGMVRVNVWVPVEYAEEMHSIAKEMRDEFKKQKAEVA